MLYQLELSGQDPKALMETEMLEMAGADVRRFALELVEGVRERREEIDALISTHSTNWKLSRMAAVDKNILRMAVFELMSCGEIPTKVTINEAVEIAKKFGSAESGAFVNGILDNIAHVLRGGADDE